jgi:hypothetical protein
VVSRRAFEVTTPNIEIITLGPIFNIQLLKISIFNILILKVSIFNILLPLEVSIFNILRLYQ